MGKYKQKTEPIDAIQFNGKNDADILSMVGYRTIDRKGDFEIPNFALAEDWINLVGTGQYVLWVKDDWKLVSPTDWIMCIDGVYDVIDDATFQATYEATTDGK